MRRYYFNTLKSLCLFLVITALAASCKKSPVVNNNNNNTNNSNNNNNNNTNGDTTAVSYTLLWSDEFNGTSVDTVNNWNFEKGSLGVNNEKEYYQSQNATVANGYLQITAKNESVGGFPYTSARMNTQNKFIVTYGKIEARIKLPMGAGLWPAFWMLGQDISSVSWPNCGEIDIMEHINADSLIYGTMHWSNGGNAASYGLNLASSPSQWHVYSVVWDANSIKWYVDNTLYVTGNIANNINSTDAFHKPFFVILNLAVAGDFPGQTVDLSKLPATMYVDYVRVYKAN